MDELRTRRVAAMDNRNGGRNKRLTDRPDRIALWAVAMAVVAMIAGVASARAGSSGGIGSDGGGTGAGATTAGATDCTGKDRATECDEFATFDWARQRATWYGPGFFGNQTACGKTLTRRTTGVAHRTLPCGSNVVLAYKGRYVRTKVIDRGPFANGAKWDLAHATARALEFEYTDDIRVAKLGT
jgi:rare lipoprotein A (peptidoglycan hydrolase)